MGSGSRLPDAGPFAVAVVATTLGPVCAAATADGIVGAEVRAEPEAFTIGVARRTGRAGPPAALPAAVAAPARAHLERFVAQLTTFLDGAGGDFDVPVSLEGCTAWDRRVLEAVRSIPFGCTASYGEIARRAGAHGAARAVGAAVGRNPIALLVPCHRVIAGDGTLGGYGGSWPIDREAALDLKEALLALEGVRVPRRREGRLPRA